MGVVQPALSTTFQEHVPGSMHGRVFGLRSAVGRSATPVGNLLAVAIGSWSVAGAVAIAGSGIATVGAVIVVTRLLAPIDRSPSVCRYRSR